MFTRLSSLAGIIADGVDLRAEVAQRLDERGAIGLACR